MATDDLERSPLAGVDLRAAPVIRGPLKRGATRADAAGPEPAGWIYLASVGLPPSSRFSPRLHRLAARNVPGLSGDGGYFLHGYFLKFHHPITGELINLEAALPSGFSSRQ